MSNPARDLLNYVDDHKEEMKDDTYKGIVDRLAPINKVVEEKTKSKYNVYFIVCSFDADDDDDAIAEIRNDNRQVEIFLSQADAKMINKKLDECGSISHFWPDDLESQGIQTVCTIF